MGLYGSASPSQQNAMPYTHVNTCTLATKLSYFFIFSIIPVFRVNLPKAKGIALTPQNSRNICCSYHESKLMCSFNKRDKSTLLELDFQYLY